MKITLLIEGIEKEFKTGERIPALMFKEAMILAEELRKDFNIEKLDKAVEFIANKLFHKQFTPEEMWEGLESHELFKIVPECLQHPMAKIEQKLSEIKK